MPHRHFSSTSTLSSTLTPNTMNSSSFSLQSYRQYRRNHTIGKLSNNRTESSTTLIMDEMELPAATINVLLVDDDILNQPQQPPPTTTATTNHDDTPRMTTTNNTIPNRTVTPPSNLLIKCINFIKHVQSLIPSLFTVMNVLVIVFLVQAIFSIGTTFGVLFHAGETTARQVVLLQHSIIYNKLSDEIHKFVNPSEFITSTLHGELVALGGNPQNLTRWARAMAMTGTFTDYLDYIYFGRADNKMVLYANKPTGQFTLVPCVQKTNVTNPYDLTDQTQCKASHVRYEIVDSVIQTQSYRHQNFSFNILVRPWFKAITDQVGTTDFDFPPSKQYTVWSDIFRSESRLSITQSLLVRDQTSGKFVGVAAIQYLTKSISDFLNATAEQGNTVIILDKSNQVLAASTNHKASKVLHEPQLIQTFPRDFSNESIYSVIYERMKSHNLSSDENAVLSGDLSIDGNDYYFSASSVFKNGLYVKIIIISDHTGFLSYIIDTSLTSLVVLILLVSFGIVVLIIILKTVTYPLQRLNKIMDNILVLDGTRTMVGETSKSIFYDIRKMEHSVEKFRKSIFYFSLFCPELVVKSVLKSSETMFPIKKQQMSLMVVDLEDVGEIQSLVGSEYYCQILNSIISEITGAVHGNDGFVFELSVVNGVRLYALWNDSSLPVENHEVKACVTGYEVQQILQQKNELLKHNFESTGTGSGSGSSTFSFKIVLSTGPVVLGYTGSTSSRINFSCFGETVAMGNYLIQKTRPNMVIMCDDVYVKVKQMFLCYYQATLPYKESTRSKNEKNPVDKIDRLDIYCVEKWMKESNAFEQRIGIKLKELQEIRASLNYLTIENMMENSQKARGLYFEVTNMGYEGLWFQDQTVSSKANNTM